MPFTIVKYLGPKKMWELPLVASLEMHAMALKIHDFGELRVAD